MPLISCPNLLAPISQLSSIMSLNKRPQPNSCARCFLRKRIMGEQNVNSYDELAYKRANKQAGNMRSH